MASNDYVSIEPPSSDISGIFLNSSLIQEQFITYVTQRRTTLGKPDLLKKYGQTYKIMTEDIKSYINNSFLVSNVSLQTSATGY
jgi:hypothetical protein